jgi:hypothetical protein
VAVAAGVVRVREVPERLVAALGIVLAHVGEREARDVVGPLAGGLVDRRLVLVEDERLAIPLGGLQEAVVPGPALVRELDDLVHVVAVLEVLQDLRR